MSKINSSEPLSDRDIELASTGLAGQAELLAKGSVSAAELVDLSLRRIAATQSTLNAFRVVCEEEARAEAEAADRRLADGGDESAPLLGVPIAIKDDVDLAGHTTPFGCAGEYPPAREDAELVKRLRKAGAIIVGKTNAPEVGQWHFTESPEFGATRNPWNTDHTPGGSSGGAAAAVAAGVVPAAIGSDGAGSVRIPAGWTGLVGLKPQRGRISTWPDAEAFYGLTSFGPLARSVGDAALLLDAVTGNREGDLHRPPAPDEPFAVATAREPRRLRIAVSLSTPFGLTSKVDPEVRAATERMANRLADLGHEVVWEDPSYGLVGLGLVARGMPGVHAWLENHVPANAPLESRTRVHGRFGKALSGPPLRAARAAEPAMSQRIGEIFQRVDVVMTPTTAGLAPRIGDLDGRGYWRTSTVASSTCPFAFVWNVTGWPGLNVPAGLNSNGVPIGVQLLGHQNEEAKLLRLGAQLEAQGTEPSGGAIVRQLLGAPEAAAA